MKRILLFAILLFILPQVSALVDLVSPADGFITNAEDVTFEYYPSVEGVTECTLSVGNQSFIDTTITNNGFNSFTVVNMDPGEYIWRISCSGETTELSVIRTLTIDRTAPTVTILSPTEEEVANNAEITLGANDDQSTAFHCTVNANATYVTDFTIEGTHTEELPLIENGLYVLLVTCLDEAGNAGSTERIFTLDLPPPTLFLELITNKEQYALGESVLLTIDTLNGADVDVEVCPNEEGFVQCYTPITTGTYPQTSIVPFTNSTGEYLVDGIALFGEQIATAQITYTVENTMQLDVTSDREPELDRKIELTANTAGAIGDVEYNWTLSNGSTAEGDRIDITYDTPGIFTEQVTATDDAGNTVSGSFRAEITPLHQITITVLDELTNEPLREANVHFEIENADSEEMLLTNSDGEALFFLEQERYKLFVSKNGYDYHVDELIFKKKTELTITLKPQDTQRPTVTLLSPENNAEVTLPVHVKFRVEDADQNTCTLSYGKEGDQWLQQGESVTLTNQEATFELSSLEETSYKYMVECVDQSNNRGESVQHTFSVKQRAQEQEEEEAQATLPLNDEVLDLIDRAYGAYDSFNAEQRKVADLLGWEEKLKQMRRTVQRLERDINSLAFRRDLNEDEKSDQIEELRLQVDAVGREIPLDIVIHEKSSRVEYMKEEQLADLASNIIKDKGYAFTPEELVTYLSEVQKVFTVQTDLVRAKLLLATGEQPISLISQTFQYAWSPEESESYTIYQSIPLTMASRAGEITTLNEETILRQQPLALEFAAEKRITYYVEKDLSMSVLGQVKTVLLKKPTAEELKRVTGSVIFSKTVFDWKLSLLLTLLLGLAIFLFNRFNLFEHIRYLVYAESPKKPMHQVRVLVNDAKEQLNAGNLDAAMMRYKEAKLSYEQLSTYAKNETIDDLTQLRHELDAQYFATLTERINEKVKAGDLDAAIDDFARLEGTYELLGEADQHRLYTIMLDLAKHLGLSEGEESGGAA